MEMFLLLTTRFEIFLHSNSPFFVSCDFSQEFLDVLVVAHRAEVFFEILDCLVVSQDVSGAASDVHHVRACLLNDFGNLKLKTGSVRSRSIYVIRNVIFFQKVLNVG